MLFLSLMKFRVSLKEKKLSVYKLWYYISLLYLSRIYIKKKINIIKNISVIEF